MNYRWEVYHRMEPSRLLATVAAETAAEAIASHLTAKHGEGDHSGLGSALSASRLPFNDAEAIQATSDVVNGLPVSASVTLRIVRRRDGSIAIEVLERKGYR